MARRPAPPGVDRREQILEAALDVFAEEGFEGATTKEIAARADVTHGLIYFYFPSKDDLFNAAFEHQARSDFALLDFSDERDSSDAPGLVLRRIVGRLVTVLGAPRSMRIMRMMMRMSANREQGKPGEGGGNDGHERRGAAHEAMHARIRGILTSLTECLSAQMARGALRPIDPQLAAELLLGGITITLVRRFKAPSTGDTLTPDELADAIVGLCAHGLVSASPPVSMPTDAHGGRETLDTLAPLAPPTTPTCGRDATALAATTPSLTTQGI